MIVKTAISEMVNYHLKKDLSLGLTLMVVVGVEALFYRQQFLYEKESEVLKFVTNLQIIFLGLTVILGEGVVTIIPLH